VLDGVDSDAIYDYVFGKYMYDQTSRLPIVHESISNQTLDPDRNVTGPPVIWADAGSDSSGNRRVQFWPIPEDTRTIEFPGYVRLTDIVPANDSLQVDPYFGPLVQWAPTFVAGMRYYHDQDNNEDASQLFGQRGVFRKLIRRQMARNRLSMASAMRLGVVTQGPQLPRGRLDPAHFDNRSG
jgi:hypothetical protein